MSGGVGGEGQDILFSPIPIWNDSSWRLAVCAQDNLLAPVLRFGDKILYSLKGFVFLNDPSRRF